MTYTIYETKDWEDLLCPKHHIRLTYQNENGELVLKCDWCNFTLVPLTQKRKEMLGLCKPCKKSLIDNIIFYFKEKLKCVM